MTWDPDDPNLDDNGRPIPWDEVVITFNYGDSVKYEGPHNAEALRAELDRLDTNKSTAAWDGDQRISL